MAAFNLKNNVDVLIDRVTVRDSEIGFRVRGQAGGYVSAHVEVRNAVVHDVAVGVRYEDDIERLHFFHATLGLGVGQSFFAASSGRAGLDVRNVLFVDGTRPVEAAAASNVVAGRAAVVDARGHDYRLVAGATTVIDRGEPLPQVTTDRDGRVRPQVGGPDVGAYEFCGGAPTAPTGVRVVAR
jgi:hypothetical protein